MSDSGDAGSDNIGSGSEEEGGSAGGATGQGNPAPTSDQEPPTNGGSGAQGGGQASTGNQGSADNRGNNEDDAAPARLRRRLTVTSDAASLAAVSDLRQTVASHWRSNHASPTTIRYLLESEEVVEVVEIEEYEEYADEDAGSGATISEDEGSLADDPRVLDIWPAVAGSSVILKNCFVQYPCQVWSQVST